MTTESNTTTTSTMATMATTSIMDLECWEEGSRESNETDLDSRLERELPFPHGILLPGPDMVSAEAFGALDESRQDLLAKECPSGPLLDGLIMLIRALMANGINLAGQDKDLIPDTRLWDIAAHRWGYRRYNDFVMKGHLFEILRDTAGADGHQSYNPTLEDLLRHPLVRNTIWGHPHVRFYQQCTSVRTAATDKWEQAVPDFLSDREQAIRLPFRPGHGIDLTAYFAAKTGIIAQERRQYVLASEFPRVIPVIMRGGRPFNDVRVFELEGAHWVPGPTANTAQLKPKFYARYVLNLVLNMRNGDARHYDENTTNLCENLEVAAPGENEQHKHARAKSNVTWNFEDPMSLRLDFLLLFCRVAEYTGTTGVRPKPYTLPTYNPIRTLEYEYVDPTKIYTDFYRLSPVQRERADNPFAMWAMGLGARGNQGSIIAQPSAHSSMIAQASTRSSQSAGSSQGSMIAQASASSAQSP